MKVHHHWLALIVLIYLLVPAAPAAAQEPIVLRIDRTDASNFPAISLLVTVRNGYGGAIAGLTPADFDVSEDATLQAQPIQAVEPLVDPALPVTVLLAIDVSGSMTGAKLRDAQEAARRFLYSLGAEDSAALIAFPAVPAGLLTGVGHPDGWSGDQPEPRTEQSRNRARTLFQQFPPVS